jgi:hypothetical protein
LEESGRRAENLGLVRALAVIVFVAASLSVASPSRGSTACSFGGPAPGFGAARLELPAGADQVSLRLFGHRAMRPTAGSGPPLVQGIFVLDATTRRLIAYRVATEGDVFVHSANASVPSLAPGSYLVVAFGALPGVVKPTDSWAAELAAPGAESCSPVGAGEVFSRGAGDFHEGVAALGGAAAVVRGGRTTMTATRSLVIGVMDASVQFAGTAKLDYTLPGSSGTVSDALHPFVSTAGPYAWTANVQGAFPTLAVAGVAIDP